MPLFHPSTCPAGLTQIQPHLNIAALEPVETSSHKVRHHQMHSLR